MLNNVFGHWKATFGGILLATWHVLANGRSKQDLLQALVLAIFGAVLKDH